jgi:hypothetical protein
MTPGFKDSPEVVEFRKLFARLKDWSEDDPTSLRELARADEGIQKLGLSVLRAAGSIQKSEQSERYLFTGPVDPGFIADWRDFEERFASTLLDIRSDIAAADKTDLQFSFDYYEEPDHWHVADFKAINAARSLDAAIMFAAAQGEQAVKDAAGPIWRSININALSDEARRAHKERAEAGSKAEDAYQEFKDGVLGKLRLSPDETERRKYLDILQSIEDERLREDGMSVEEVAKDAFAFWETLKSQSGLDLRGALRRHHAIVERRRTCQQSYS